MHTKIFKNRIDKPFRILYHNPNTYLQYYFNLIKRYLLIQRGGGTGPAIPRQRVLYEYRANSIKSFDLKDEKSGTLHICASLLMKGGTFYIHPCPYLPASRRFIERGARPV
jgi:hypothetical protein